METKQWAEVGDSRYNFEHFTPDLLTNGRREKRLGPRLGERAPEFTLEDTEGRSWNLANLQGRPVVLILGSASCPMTHGSLPGLLDVFHEFGDRTQWLFLYVREAHPGEHLPAHNNLDKKRENARFFRELEDLEWPVIVDDLAGTTHRMYGLLPNPVFLIDSGGRVAFRGDHAHAPTLRNALKHLIEQGDRGVVCEGYDRRTHMLGAATYGWEAILRSGETARHDVAVSAPPLAANLWLGSHLKRVLDPVARRTSRIPFFVRAGITVGLGMLAVGGLLFLGSKDRAGK